MVTTYILRRLLIVAPLLAGLSVILFLMVSYMPGDPIDLMVSPDLGPEQAAQRRAQLGLDQPIYVRYANWVVEILQGNIGYSFITRQPVAKMIWERVPATVLLMGLAMLLALVIGIPLGIASALKKGTWTDNIATLVAFGGISVPNFFLAIVAIYVFSVKLHWLPSAGMSNPGADFSLMDRISRLIMPMIVLSFYPLATFMRYMRSSMLEVIRADYVRTARAKGLSERVVVYKHALRNALLPVITLLGLQFRWLFGGSVIIERIYAWPGIGRLMVDSVFSRDNAVVMAIVMISAIMVIAGNLMADISYAFVDPRIKYD